MFVSTMFGVTIFASVYMIASSKHQSARFTTTLNNDRTTDVRTILLIQYGSIIFQNRAYINSQLLQSRQIDRQVFVGKSNIRHDVGRVGKSLLAGCQMEDCKRRGARPWKRKGLGCGSILQSCFEPYNNIGFELCELFWYQTFGYTGSCDTAVIQAVPSCNCFNRFSTVTDVLNMPVSPL